MKSVPLPEGRIKRTVYARDGYRCRYCNVMTSYQQKNMPYSRTVDHVIPRSKGGRTSVVNLVTCCKACNDAKKSFTLAEMGWKMLPRPARTEEQLDEWRRRTFAFACVHCCKPPRLHTRPDYHGGPRRCPTGDTFYMAMAHYTTLVARGQDPSNLWSVDNHHRQPDTTIEGTSRAPSLS